VTSQTHDIHQHDYVLFDSSKIDVEKTSLRGPCGVLLVTDDAVWIYGDYCDLVFEFVEPVTRNGEPALDVEGNCIIAVPRKYVKAWLTEDEAVTVWRCMDESDRLLSYAH